MPKSKKQGQNPTSSALSKWEKAGEKLATALSDYLQSCRTLDTLSSPQNPDIHSIAPPIEKSLSILHVKLYNELSQSRVILAQMRNKISSRSYSLPNEVLAEIFKLVVYTPGPDDRHHQPMVDRIQRIYRRLHSLLGVCSSWRNVGIALSELWSVIPAADRKTKLLTPAATSLAIERSQALTSTNHQAHLAVILSEEYSLHTPLEKTAIPRFTSINIEARFDSPYTVSSLLEKILPSQAPEVLSELSIYQNLDELEARQKPRVPHPNEVIGCHTSVANRAHFTKFIRSLSILRLRRAYIDWSKITFSNKLVHIHLQSLVLENHTKLNDLLRVLESAPELRDLKMISVLVIKHRNSSALKISLPQLKSLLLDDLSFNVLNHVLASIPSGSHQLKVGLTRKSMSTGYEDEDEEFGYDEFEMEEDFGFEDIGPEPVIGLLNRSNIDTLFLDTRCRRSHYMNRGWLRSILKSLPGLKTLILDGWKWDSDDFSALQRPDNSAFPNLTGLYIVNSFVYNEAVIPSVVTSHSLQTLVMERGSFKAKDGRVFQWLKQKVPDFRLVMSIRCMFDFNHEKWELW